MSPWSESRGHVSSVQGGDGLIPVVNHTVPEHANTDVVPITSSPPHGKPATSPGLRGPVVPRRVKVTALDRPEQPDIHNGFDAVATLHAPQLPGSHRPPSGCVGGDWLSPRGPSLVTHYETRRVETTKGDSRRRPRLRLRPVAIVCRVAFHLRDVHGVSRPADLGQSSVSGRCCTSRTWWRLNHMAMGRSLGQKCRSCEFDSYSSREVDPTVPEHSIMMLGSHVPP